MASIFEIGNDLQIRVALANTNGTGQTATTLALTITDPRGSTVATATISDFSVVSTGTYAYTWNTSSLTVHGPYTIRAVGTMTNGTRYSQTHVVSLTGA